MSCSEWGLREALGRPRRAFSALSKLPRFTSGRSGTSWPLRDRIRAGFSSHSRVASTWPPRNSKSFEKAILQRAVRTLNPVPDPARPVYKQGHAGQPVIDHIRPRAAGGHPNDPSNLHVKPWKWNARKGAYEGQLLKARQYYIRQGLTPEQADAILAQEWEWLMNDVLASPVDHQFFSASLSQVPGDDGRQNSELSWRS